MSDQEYGMDLSTDMGFDLPASVETTNGFVGHENPLDAPQDDDFWGNAFDEEAVADALRNDLPPEGNYKGEGLTLEERKNPFNGNNELGCYGRAYSEAGNTATVRFNLLPRKLYKENGKLEWNHVLYKQVVKAYVKVKGTNPTSADDFKDFIANGCFEYRLVHNQKATGMQVMGIQAAESDIPF